MPQHCADENDLVVEKEEGEDSENSSEDQLQRMELRKERRKALNAKVSTQRASQ